MGVIHYLARLASAAIPVAGLSTAVTAQDDGGPAPSTIGPRGQRPGLRGGDDGY